MLLVDEIDRADDEFEAFLLEVLSDFTISIPELGTVRAMTPPLVVLTSNRTREVHDALKRRCLYHWLEHPDFDREVAILRRRLPEVTEQLAREVARATAKLRTLDLLKPPGIAEAMDWATALHTLGRPRPRPGPRGPHAGRRPQVPRGHRPGARPGPGGALRWLRTSHRPRGTSSTPCSGSPARCAHAGVAASPDRVEAMLAALGALDVLDADRRLLGRPAHALRRPRRPRPLRRRLRRLLRRRGAAAARGSRAAAAAAAVGDRAARARHRRGRGRRRRPPTSPRRPAPTRCCATGTSPS